MRVCCSLIPGPKLRALISVTIPAAFLFLPAAHPQEKSARVQKHPPPSGAALSPTATNSPPEPLIIESLITHARFEDDGSGRIETSTSIRVQNEAGARSLSEIVFAYNAGSERMEIPYVRVRRTDSSVIEAPPGSVQDLAAQAVRDAPLYSDAREKHLSVPLAHPGEIIEYAVVELIQQPLIPGQFWFDYDFEKNSTTLDQQLTLDLPASRPLKVGIRPGLEPRIEEKNGRRVYSWTTSHTASTKDSATAKPAEKISLEEPDIRISNFASWEALGAWYQSVVRTGAAVTPEIQQKADEITKSAKSPAEEFQAIYDYVALDFRFVSLPFGAVRLEPRPLAAILKNGYADSGDKHALFSALAAAKGLRADAVLIHSEHSLDSGVPTPAAFNRVLTRINSAGEVIWLDTATEVAPFGFLLSALRHKQALAIPAEGPAVFVETPDDPPFPVHQFWRLDGKVSELGKLDAHVHYLLRGDNEVLLRLAFRRAPQAKWRDLGRAIAASDGLRGEVDGVTPANPSDTRHPFTLDYHVVVPGYLDWTSRRAQLVPPLPALALPEAAQAGTTLTLGSPAEITIEMKISLPARYTARAPAATSLSREYGDYRSSYSSAEGAIHASRTLSIRSREIRAAAVDDFRLFFQRAVRNDESQSFGLESAPTSVSDIPSSVSSDDLVEAATRSYSTQQFPVAEQLLVRAVRVQPAHKQAWKLLGAVRLARQENAEAAEAFRKQIELTPNDEFAYEGLGLAQAALGRYEDAIASFRKQLQVKPLDPMAQASLGATLGETGRWPEAVTELEKAVVLSPDDPRLYISLGRAELSLEHVEKAAAAFEKAVELSPSPPVWNDAARELVEHHAALDCAQKYAELAVAGAESDLSNVTLEKLSSRDIARTSTLATYWDTLGWVAFVRGDLKRAERFANAAWLLDFRGEAGEHLGRIYEQQGQRELATRFYALALNVAPSLTDARARLVKLAGGMAQADAIVARTQDDPSLLRDYGLPRLVPTGTMASAEFYVLLGGGPHPEAVKFIRGDASLRGAAESIRALNFGRMLPDETPAKLVRRGRLGCSADNPSCTFTIFPASQVRGLE